MSKSGMRKRLSSKEAQTERKRWNAPEWDKPEQYGYVQKLDGDRLRWEFLRRDEIYRKQYEKNHQTKLHPILGAYIPPQICGDELPKEFSFFDTKNRGGPLLIPPPPIKAMLFTKEQVTADHKIHEYYGIKLEELLESGYIVMVFDPMRPTTNQMKDASKFLNEYHNEHAALYPDKTIKGKRSPKDPAKLLRVLDASLVGVNNQTIAAEIFETERYENQLSIGKERLDAARTYWRVM